MPLRVLPSLLVVGKQRARTEADREARRRAFLDAAHALWPERTLASFTMHEVAERVGLSKPTLYLYFPTKEELLLALLRELLRAWFVELRERLSRTSQITAADLADGLAGLLGAHAPMTHLLAILPSILEQNVAAESIIAYKLQLQTELEQTGPLLEASFAVLRPGDGARLLMQLSALAIGLFQMSTPPPAIQALLAAHPKLASAPPNPEATLRHHIVRLLAGWAAADQ